MVKSTAREGVQQTTHETFSAKSISAPTKLEAYLRYCLPRDFHNFHNFEIHQGRDYFETLTNYLVKVITLLLSYKSTLFTPISLVHINQAVRTLYPFTSSHPSHWCQSSPQIQCQPRSSERYLILLSYILRGCLASWLLAWLAIRVHMTNSCSSETLWHRNQPLRRVDLHLCLHCRMVRGQLLYWAWKKWTNFWYEFLSLHSPSRCNQSWI